MADSVMATLHDLVLRDALTAAYHDPPGPGRAFFNTHHGIYQAEVSATRWVVLPPELVEMNDAQLEVWIRRLHEVRRLARERAATEKRN